jgi:hypothetical protein
VRVDPKEKAVKIMKDLKPHPEIERTSRIVKDMTKPAPGDYKTEEAFEKTQATNIKYKVDQAKLSSFVDDYKKRKSYLPGIGIYEVSNRLLDRVTRSPPLNRTLRH